MARTWWPPALLVGTVATLLLIGALGLAMHEEGYVSDRGLAGLMAVGFGALGSWVWLRAVPVVGRRMASVSCCAAINWAAQCWSATLIGAWVSQWSWFAPVLVIPLVLTRFPDGARRTGRTGYLETLLIGCVLVIVGLLAAAALGAPRTLVADPAMPAPAWARVLLRAAVVASFVWGALVLVLVVVMVTDALRRSGSVRGQFVVLGVALLVTIGGLAGLALVGGGAFQVIVALALPLGIGAAVLRYSLYDLDLLVRRFPVWVVLALLTVVATVGVVWLVIAAWPAGRSRWVQVTVLTALVLVLSPLHRASQSWVSRLLFGRREAPAEALADLSRGLGFATAQLSREELCRSVATTLALPWVGLRVANELAAHWGRPTSAPLEVPLGSGVTTLLLCPRRAGEHFVEADLRIVRAMAAQVDVATRALDTADELQRARGNLVRSREEERRRLRNDLHDGLGPALAGIRMQVHALSGQSSPAWRQVYTDLEGCAAEIARVVEGLRPPVLGDGLIRALQGQAARWSGPATRVSVLAQGLGSRALPAAVEIAAYRIVTEAVSNAVRHGRARTITVTLSSVGHGVDCALCIQVSDDGTGVVRPRNGGVGMVSMRERAEELGGSVVVVGEPGTGVTVNALLPLQATNGSVA